MATSEGAKAFQASRTIEQRRETALSRWRDRSPAERSKIAAKIVLARTPAAFVSLAKRKCTWENKSAEEKADIYSRMIATRALNKKPLTTICHICKLRERDLPLKNNSYCKKCKREWFAARNYGLSVDQYRGLLAHGKCYLCERSDLHLHIDHDHETNVVRGLLCQFCNWFVSHIERVTPDVVAKAQRYVAGEHLAIVPTGVPYRLRKKLP